MHMIERLIDNIRAYADYLSQLHIYVSVHTGFCADMLPLLPLNLHRNPQCLLVKSDSDAWDACIRLHTAEDDGSMQIRRRTCHAGVEETVFPLSCGGTVCAAAEGMEAAQLSTLVEPLCRMIEYLKHLSPDDREETTESELVNRAVKYIQRHFYLRISNAEGAAACACSVSTLCHLFKTHKCTSVHAFISEARITYAQQLLATGRLSVTAIAQKAGFSDYNGFTRRFKKATGLSPTAYRRQHGRPT